MKRHMIYFCLLIWLGGCGGGGSGSSPRGMDDGGDTSGQTAKGIPVGDPVAKAIGPAGGTLSSIDGALTLIVPEGALDDVTQIAIQEITNQAPGGKGAAFRLTPENLHSNIPMTILFHYTDEQMQGTAPRFSTIAYQSSDYYWRAYNEPELNEATRTLSVETDHFSDWSYLVGVQLLPGSAVVNTRGGLTLQIKRCELKLDHKDDLSDIAIVTDCNIAPLEAFSADGWSVNGIEGGGGGIGTITADSDSSTGIAIYSAPDKVPTVNPVAVSVEVMDIDNPSDLTTLISNVTIVEDPADVCTAIRTVNALNVDIEFEPYEWSASTPEESYEGHQYGHMQTVMLNQIPASKREDSPIGYWTSQFQPHVGLVQMDDTHLFYESDHTVTAHVVAEGVPYSDNDITSYVTFIVNYSTCEYEVVADFVVEGTVNVDGNSDFMAVSPGGIYYRNFLTHETMDTGVLQVDAELPVRYDNDPPQNGYYPAGQNSVLRASGSTTGHWTISVAD